MADKDLFTLVLKKKWDHVIERAGIFPEESSVAYSFTFKNGVTIYTLPIHIACMKRAPLEPILALIAAEPRNCEFIDGIGRTPLHNALRYGSTHRVISVLIAIHPKAVFLKASDGKLPIHLACLNATSKSEDIPIIKHLLWVNPGSIHDVDVTGSSPKDYAIQNPNTDLGNEIICILNNFEVECSNIDRRNDFENDDRRNDFSRKNQPSTNNTLGLLVPYESIPMPNNETPKAQTDIRIKQCIVCMEKNVSMVFVPCGHPCLCDSCASDEAMNRMKWKCPECRSLVSEVIRFFGRVTID